MANASRLIALLALVGTLALLGCNDHPVAPLSENLTAETQETTVQVSPSKVDILWVVDNSRSMCEEQADLRDNFAAFVEELDRIRADFQLAVVTTDMFDENESGRFQNIPRASDNGACGVVVDISDCPTPANGGDYAPLILKSSDYQTENNELDVETLKRDFGCNATAGTDGNNFEMGLDAARAALDLGLRQGFNRGFLRDDAYLAVIFLTDENDCSNSIRLHEGANGNVCEWESHKLTPTQEYIDFFANLKGGDKDRVIMGGIISPDIGLRFPEGERIQPSCYSLNEANEITGQGFAGYRYQEVINAFAKAQTGSPISDICNPPFDNALESLAGIIVDAIDQRCLNTPPATCQTDADCPGAENTCTSPNGSDAGRKFCSSFRVQVEIDRDAEAGELEGRECTTTGDTVRCILNEGDDGDFTINYNDTDCKATGISIELDYIINEGEQLRLRYLREVDLGGDDEPASETPAPNEPSGDEPAGDEPAGDEPAE